MMGAGPGIDLVAVTPDGETVIAAKTEGVLSRLDLSGAGPADDSRPVTGRFRLLGTAITAIAVDGTGSRVLASRPDGTLWLHDMTGGPATELRAPEASPEPDPPDQRWWESAGTMPAPGARIPPWSRADDDTEIWRGPAEAGPTEESAGPTATYRAEAPRAPHPAAGTAGWRGPLRWLRRRRP
jgi:hypothetical protein